MFIANITFYNPKFPCFDCSCQLLRDRLFLMGCIYKFGRLGASGEFISTLQQPELIIVWKDAGLHAFSSDTAITNLVGRRRAVGIHIYLHLDCTLTPPRQRSASSMGICACACMCVCVCWGEEAGMAGLSEGWFVSPPWKWSYTFGAITRRICHFMSLCLWPLGCALSHISPVSWRSAQEGSLCVTMSF